MPLGDIANLATALSLVVATLAFLLSVIDRNSRERSADVLKWQRVVVYQLIESGNTAFSDIKVHYLAAAQQLTNVRLPKREIQDGALQLILLSLMEARLVSKTDQGTFAVNVVSTQENMVRDAALIEFEKRALVTRAMSQVYDLLDRDSGKYTPDQVFRHLKIAETGLEYADFNVVVIREQINRNVFALDREQRLWLRSRIPAQTPGKA
jgi:hypothetical protein